VGGSTGAFAGSARLSQAQCSHGVLGAVPDADGHRLSWQPRQRPKAGTAQLQRFRRLLTVWALGLMQSASPEEDSCLVSLRGLRRPCNEWELGGRGRHCTGKGSGTGASARRRQWQVLAAPTAGSGDLSELALSVGSTLLLVSPFSFWGSSMVAMKDVLPQAGPMFVAAFRLIPAGALLVAYAASRGRPMPSSASAWGAILAFAAVDAACFQGCLSEGLKRTSAGPGLLCHH